MPGTVGVVGSSHVLPPGWELLLELAPSRFASHAERAAVIEQVCMALGISAAVLRAGADEAVEVCGCIVRDLSDVHLDGCAAARTGWCVCPQDAVIAAGQRRRDAVTFAGLLDLLVS